MKSGPSIMHIVFKALGFFGLPARERKGNMTSLSRESNKDQLLNNSMRA